MSRLGQIITKTPIIWVRHLLLGMLVILGAWLFVRLIIAVMAPESLYEPVLIASATEPVSYESRDYDFSYNPFTTGETEVASVEAPPPGDDAPETTLNLQLKGLRSGENGTAYIQTPDGQEDNFYIGDEIMPGVTLQGVFPDYVLIDVNGQMQRLTTADAKAARRNPGSDRATTKTLQTIGKADAATFLSQISLIPAFDLDMRRIGLNVKARSAGVDLSTYGLREGDTLTRIERVSLISGLPDMASLRQIARSGRPVQIDLIRDGQPMTITIGSDT